MDREADAVAEPVAEVLRVARPSMMSRATASSSLPVGPAAPRRGPPLGAPHQRVDVARLVADRLARGERRVQSEQ